MNRVTSAFFVSALIRRANSEGAFATLTKRGAQDAGAIAIVIEDKTLLLPASQHLLPDDGERYFSIVIESGDLATINIRLIKELKFDPDLWIINIDDKLCRHFVTLLH